jgi:hypothetical protein
VPAQLANGSRPPLWVAGRGFYREEGDLPDQWNWSEGDAEMNIHHDGDGTARVEMSCSLRSLTRRQVLIRLPDGSSGGVAIAGAGVTAPVRLRFSLHRGWNTVRFESDGPPVYPQAPPESRRLAFMVAELQLREDSRGQEPGSR